MKLGIMQPYLFPHVDYFQLIQVVDKFVVHDDVQYIKGGWINRNRIQINNKDYLFRFSIKKDAFHKNINERFFSNQIIKEKTEFLRVIKNTYKKAPYFPDVYDVLMNILAYDEQSVSLFTTNSLITICNYLGIKTPFYISSKLKKNNKLKGQNRVINICKTMGASIYINPIGGTSLYSKSDFEKNNISLLFLHSKEIIYEYKKRQFIPNLSIIDVMMFNSIKEIENMLDSYELI